MNNLKIGYSECNVNPPLGYPLHGYYMERFGTGFINDLMAGAIAVSDGEKTVLILSVDNGGFKQTVIRKLKNSVSSAIGVEEDGIFISATHSHTAPSTFYPEFFDVSDENINAYIDFLAEKLCEISALAIEDLCPAKAGYGIGYAPDRISYIRRYRMKDGTTCTCPPINDPNIDRPIGELDRRVNVLRFKRDVKEDVVILNYGIHADTVNGDAYCSDWVGFCRDTVARALEGAKCVCIMGAQGDVGSTNVHPIPGDMNDTEISFDNEMKSVGMARFVGRALAGVVLQVFDKVAFFDAESISFIEEEFPVRMNVPKKEDLPLARKYKELYESGRSDEIPYTGMELTTVVAEALRICKMENDPEYSVLNISALRIGDVGLVTVPGEPFTEIGVEIKKCEGYGLILPCAITNGYEGYFPAQSAFAEGGYEARTSPYKEDISNRIIVAAKKVLSSL